jgi:hypothetical protein
VGVLLGGSVVALAYSLPMTLGAYDSAPITRAIGFLFGIGILTMAKD